MAKKVYDFRGSEANIFRLRKFDTEGLIHSLFYRILLLLAPLYAATLLLSLVYLLPIGAVKIFTIIIWILITPQLFEGIKAISLTSTHGAAFGKFSDAYGYLVSKKRKPSYLLYKILPYFVVIVWIAFFVGMLIWWPL
jgi:hypothetical protein